MNRKYDPALIRGPALISRHHDVPPALFKTQITEMQTLYNYGFRLRSIWRVVDLWKMWYWPRRSRGQYHIFHRSTTCHIDLKPKPIIVLLYYWFWCCLFTILLSSEIMTSQYLSPTFVWRLSAVNISFCKSGRVDVWASQLGIDTNNILNMFTMHQRKICKPFQI